MSVKYYELLFGVEALNSWLTSEKFPTEFQRKLAKLTLLEELYYDRDSFVRVVQQLESDRKQHYVLKQVLELQKMNTELIAQVTPEAIALERVLLMFDQKFLRFLGKDTRDFLVDFLEEKMSLAEACERLSYYYEQYALKELPEDELKELFGAVESFNLIYGDVA